MNRYDDYDKRGAIARILNFTLGAWLIISAFAWPHSAEQQANTWILGVLSAAFAMIALVAAPKVRLLNTLVALWLLISAFALPSISTATVWNNVIVAMAMFLLSLVPSNLPARFGAPRAAT